MDWEVVGTVTHYFGRLSVAAVRLTGQLQLGDHIHILGSTSDFEQPVTSMQLDHESIELAEPGQEIGLRVVERVRCGDTVYRVL